jgi:tetratricopeptide (TPR) repeat protein
VLLAALAAASCSRPKPPAVERIAIASLDNLSGDASLNWLSVGAQQILVQELAGVPDALAVPAADASAAHLARAHRMLHGYFDRRGGKIHFEISMEDLARNKIACTDSAEGEPLDALHRLATDIAPSARPFSGSLPEAVEAWARGDSRRAIDLDPDFGGAWFTYVQSLAGSGDADGARAAAAEALARRGLRFPIERAQIRFAASVLQNDRAERETALKELAPLLPADPTVSRALAEAEMNARHFPEAARAYRAIIRADPDEDIAYNLLGYAEAFAGTPDAAREDFEQYGRRPGQATNALDSLGEAMFSNGRFADAEKSFLEAYAKDPNFLMAEPLWKAAHARWLKGDNSGADMLAERYFERLQNPAAALRRANWLYETGRRDQAVALLRRAPSEAAEKQLAVWSNPGFPTDLDQLKQLYERTSPAQDGLARTLYAAALVRAGRKDEARELLRLWPLPERPDSLYQAFVLPRYLELRKNL